MTDRNLYRRILNLLGPEATNIRLILQTVWSFIKNGIGSLARTGIAESV
jgi:hypothetical protein